MKKKLLLTGFEPFLNYDVNPTQKIVDAINGTEVGGFVIEGRVLPVDFKQSAIDLLDQYKKTAPDAVIMLGLAAGRRQITPERVAININEGPLDNRGYSPENEPIIKDGPAAYFSTLPIHKMVKRLKDAGIPAAISNTAGTYLCNHVMYRMLHHLESTNSNIPAGFIHIPASHELALSKPELPSWPMVHLIEAVKVLIETLEESS